MIPKTASPAFFLTSAFRSSKLLYRWGTHATSSSLGIALWGTERKVLINIRLNRLNDNYSLVTPGLTIPTIRIEVLANQIWKRRPTFLRQKTLCNRIVLRTCWSCPRRWIASKLWYLLNLINIMTSSAMNWIDILFLLWTKPGNQALMYCFEGGPIDLAMFWHMFKAVWAIFTLLSDNLAAKGWGKSPKVGFISFASWIIVLSLFKASILSCKCN